MATSAAGSTQSRTIRNPLLERTIPELKDDVRSFHGRRRLGSQVDVEMLIRGALAARDPRAIRKIQGITPGETQVLEDEKTWGFREQTEELKVAILVTACSAIIQGWQQSTINAAALGWGTEFDFDVSPCPASKDGAPFGPRTKLLFGFINAAPPLVGSIVGTWLSDPIQERVTGRLPALFLAALFSLAAAIGSFYASGWRSLLVFRVLMGVGMGAKASIAPVLAAEVAVDHLRGSLIMCWQLFDALGIFLGFTVSVAVLDRWRLVLGSAMIPVVPLFILIYLCPESPRFLIRKNRYRQAYDSLRRFRKTEIQACRDLYAIHSQLQIEAEIIRPDTERNHQWYSHEVYQDEVRDMHYWQRIHRLVTRKRNLRASVSSCLCMAAQQLCGINVLAFYSSSLYGVATGVEVTSSTDGKVASSHRAAAWLSFGFGLANFLFTIPAYRRIDSHGRRSLLLFSLAGMAVSLVAVAPCFKIVKDETRLIVVGTLTIVVFTFFYSVGAGPVPFTLSAEVFPLAYREVGMSVSVMVNFLGLGLLVLFVPQLTDLFGGQANNCNDKDAYKNASLTGQARLLGLFAGLNVLAFVLVFFLVPSTAAPILEELNSIFNTRIIEHLKFQWSENIPWLLKNLNPLKRPQIGPRYLTKVEDLSERQRMELEELNRSQRPAEGSPGHQRPPERDAPPMQSLPEVANSEPRSPNHPQQPDQNSGSGSHRAGSAASEAVPSVSEGTTEAVPADERLQPTSTTGGVRPSLEPLPSPNRVANAARQQRPQTQSWAQNEGIELLRDLLRRVRRIEYAVVGQQQGLHLGRYEQLPDEELTEERGHSSDRLVEDRHETGSVNQADA